MSLLKRNGELHIRERISGKIRKMTIHMVISVSFTIMASLGIIAVGISLFQIFNYQMHTTIMDNDKQLLDQTAINLENYLRNMRLVSDSVYYGAIKNGNVEGTRLEENMRLIFDSNKDNLVSIACFDDKGVLLASAPLTTVKKTVQIRKQDFYKNALNKLENFHFSNPHLQNIFDNSSSRYYWVVSLSRAVEITRNGRSSMGVLLIDMNFSTIEKIFNRINNSNAMGYTYLCDSEGQIIYHPKENLINSGILKENNLTVKNYDEGSVEEIFEGEKRLITVKTLSYTGWKIVNVTPEKSISIDMFGQKYLAIILICISVILLTLLNEVLAKQIIGPLEKLTKSLRELETDLKADNIYVGGSIEVSYLGNTLRDYVRRLKKLMDDIVIQQEEKRKTELDALQSQINPHFLYNTLDSIVWMIEGEQYEDAIFMITELASLFRISISKGKNIITIEEELKHAKNYMNIQKHRYKDLFRIEYDIEGEILKYSTVKLILQPILENAIYYGVENLNGDGEIRVVGYREGNDIFIKVKDNGNGMTKEECDNLLKENNRIRKHGSGVGLINVHNRIMLQFGQEYGVIIDSKPEEGTCVTVHLPAVMV